MTDTEKSIQKENKTNRMKYLNKIRENMSDPSKSFLLPPKEHWLNPVLFILRPQFDDPRAEKLDDIQKLNPSWLTILSIWNCMIGSSIVSIPANTKDAGIIPTIILCLIFCFICYYTCQVVVKTGGKDNDYSDTVEKYFGEEYGKVGKVIQITFSVLINIGALFIYFLIINQNLFPILNQIFGLNIKTEDLLNIDFGSFSIVYCSIIFCVIMFPFLVKKDINFLLKINSLGVYFVIIIVSFIIYTFIDSLANTKFDFELIKNTREGDVRHLKLFGENICKLAGSLSLGYFSHSIILPILKNNEKQENNRRDLFIGYILVCLTYMFLGITGYIGFSGKNYDPAFADNWFYLCDQNKWYMTLLRAMSFFQLCSIFPIISYVVRVQLFGTFYNNNYPSVVHIIIYSVIICCLSFFMLCVFIKKLTSFVGIIGAATGLFLIYIIPLGVNTIYYRIKHPLSRHIRNTLLQDLNINDSNEFGLTLSQKKPSKFKDYLFYISQTILIIFGIFTLILQFASVNFFGIEVK